MTTASTDLAPHLQIIPTVMMDDDRITVGISLGLSHLEDWSVTEGRTPGTGKLTGRVTGHHRHKDGAVIVTSSIISSEGNLVTTRSGSRYILGSPSAAYEAFLDGIGYKLNAAEPIKLLPKEEKKE